MIGGTAAIGRTQMAAPETDIVVRQAIERDLQQIVAIYNVAVATRIATAQLEPVTVESRRHWLHSDYPLLVAEVERTVAGWLSFKQFMPRCAYRGTVELSVYVGERFRRRRVARTLIEDAIARASHLDVHTLVGLIFGHNGPSLRLFEQAGFARWGLLPAVARLEGAALDLAIVGRHI